MGLATWAAAPEGKVVKSDVNIEKNYLSATGNAVIRTYCIGLFGFGRGSRRASYSNDDGGLVKAFWIYF